MTNPGDADRRSEIQDDWQPMNGMPIGDQRNIIVRVRGEAVEDGFDQAGGDDQMALAYWTGSVWAHAPIAADAVPLDFRPRAWAWP